MMTGAATRERGKRLVRGAASDERSKMNNLWAFGWKQEGKEAGNEKGK